MNNNDNCDTPDSADLLQLGELYDDSMVNADMQKHMDEACSDDGSAKKQQLSGPLTQKLDQPVQDRSLPPN
jgi:hypothetical protein